MNKFLAAAAFAFLGGCSMTPELDRPEPPVPASWAAPAEGGRQATAVAWQAFFPDPRLQALIAAALDHNRDLRIAVARVEEARAQLGIARADRFPTVNATGSRAVSHLPGELASGGKENTTQRYDAGLSMPAFELDFWNRVGALNDAARASYLATEEARRAFRLALVADVANAYLATLELSERIGVARATVESRAETRKLIDKRREVGIAGDLDALQAEGALLAAKADLASLERQSAAAENALALVVGHGAKDLPPGRSLADQGIVNDLAPGLPAEVLLARPDVLSAEQKLIAANANIGAARAAFLPKILLTAAFGTASKALSGLFSAGSGAWSFQPALSLPLFDMGRTQANVDLAEARKVVAVAEYEKAIQVAFREVADLLSARERLAEQLAAQEAAERTQADRLRLADARYQAGVSSYLEVLDAQREAYAARQGTLQVRRALLSAAAQLYKALGGGG